MAGLTVGTRVAAVLTHVEFSGSQCCGYGQLCDSATVDDLAEKVELSAAESPYSNTYNRGDIVLALYSEDGIWYRARIESPEGDALSVFFIDYGNKEKINTTDIKVATGEIKSTPGLATKCVLADVFPKENGWISSETEQLETELVGLEFTVEVLGIDSDAVALRLYSDSGLFKHGSEPTPSRSSKSANAKGLNIGMQYNAYLSYVDSANKFWIQLADLEDDLNDLMANLADAASARAEKLDRVSTGTLCMAYYSEDKAPYRSSILTVNGNQSLVQFVDYGNSESKDVSELMKLPESFQRLPPMGIKCCYKRTKVDNNTLEEKLQELTDSDSVLIRVLGHTDDVYNVEIDKIESITSPPPSASQNFTPLELDSTKVYDICLSHVEHPGRFFIQLLENGPELDQLMVRLGREYKGNITIPSLSTGAACIGQLSDNQHYRCIVQSVSSGNAVVHTVDFGFDENVGANRLHVLPPNMLTIPCFSGECTVDVTKTLDRFWSSTEIKTLKDLESKVSLVAKVTTKRNNINQLDLYDTRDQEEDRYINAEMLGVGKCAQKAHTIKMETRRADTSAVTNVVIPKPEVTIGAQELLCITAVRAPSLIYAQLTKTNAQKIESLQLKLNEKYEKMTEGELILSNFSIGSSCCTRYSDGGWYRAVIMQNQGNAVSIGFADFGDETVKQKLELKQLLPEFSILPQQCVLCQLPQVSTSKETVEKVLLNQVVELKLLSKKEGAYPIYDAELTSNQRNQGIAGKLEGSSTKQPPRVPKSVVDKDARVRTVKRGVGYEYLQVDPGRSEEIMVTHVVDPQHFHVQLTGMAKELDVVMDKLQSHFAGLREDEEGLQSAVLGQPCIAKYTDDNSWYRALVSGLLKNGMAEVTFVDYGNTECLPRETLKDVKPEFMTLPAQAIFCGISGVESSQGFWSPEHIAQFEDIALDQNFTAIFQEYKGEAEDLYMVKLQNQSGEDMNLKYGTSTNTLCLEQTNGIGGTNRKVEMGKGLDMRIKVQDSEWVDHGGSSVSDFGGKSRGGSGFGGNRGGSFGGDRGGSRSFGGGDRSGGGGFGGQNRNQGSGGGFGGKSNDRGGGFGGQNRDGGSGGRSNDRGGGFGGQNRDGGSGGFGGRSNDRAGGGFGGRSNDRAGGGESWDQEGSSGSGGRSNDRGGGGGFGGKSNDRGSGFGGQNRDEGGSGGFGGRSNDRSGGGFGGRSNDRSGGGGFGGQNRDEGGFGGRSNDRGRDQRGSGGGFGGQNRDGGGFGGKSNDRDSGGGFGGQNRDRGGGDGGFGGRKDGAFGGRSGGSFGQSQQSAPANDDWNTDTTTVVVQKPPTVTASVTASAPKSRFRGTSQTTTIPSTTSEHQSDAWSRRRGSVTFTSQKLIADTSCPVLVVHTNSPGEFWCQLAEKADEWQTLMDQMNEKFNAFSPTKSAIHQPEIGMPCVAKFSEDELWYRAEIFSFEDKKIDVRFIDYGNTETVDLACVKQIDKEFLMMHQQAVRCCLNGVKSSAPTWSDKATECFNTLTTDKELVCAVKSYVGGSYLINLEDSSGEMDVALKLHEAGHCSLVLTSLDSPQKVIVKVPYPVIPITVGSKLEVFVSWIEDPSMFWVQPVENLTTLEELVEQIQEEYTSGPSAAKKVSKISVGMAVVSLYSEDGAWYRAVVETDGKEVGIRFIDYGNTDSVAIDSLRLPSANLMEVPAQAIYCSLADVKPLQPGKWNVDAKDIMESMVKEAVSCTFKGDMEGGFNVDIVSDGVGVAEELVRAAVVKKVTESPRKPESPPKETRESPARSETPRNVVQRLNFAKQETLVSGSMELAYISQVDSLLSFYVQLAKLTANLEALMEHLDKASAGKSCPSMLVPGMACAAKFTDDEMWYRATVTQVTTNGAEVLFVDYGNSEVVSVDNICEISQDCLSLPPQAILCSLDKRCNVLDESAVQTFTDMTMDKEVGIKVISAGIPAIVDVSMDDTESFTDLLTSSSSPPPSAISGSTQADSSLPSQSIPTESNVKVFTSCVHSPAEMFLQVASQEDKLNDLTAKLQTAYSASACALSAADLKIGCVCCTKYMEDDSWYRAEVKDIQGDKCQVLFVDYGNGEEVDTSLLQVLTSEFRTQSALAYRCALDSLSPVGDGWSEDAIGHLESLTMDQELACKFVTNTTVCLTGEEGDIGEDLVAKGYAIVSRAMDLKFATKEKPQGKVPAFVSHVEDVFYLQLISEEDKLAELSENLQTLCENMSTPQPDQVKVGLHCCAKFSEDQAWYRATVSMVNGQEVTVRFVDFGNCDVVGPEHIKLLNAEVQMPAPLAYLAVIKGVGKMSAKQQTLFSSLTTDQELTTDFLELTEDSLSQVTLLTSDGKDIGLEFWTDDAAEPCVDTDGLSDLSRIEKDFGARVDKFDVSLASANECGDASSQETTRPSSQETTDDLEQLSHIALEEGARVQVTSSHINSPSSFYVHLERNKTELDGLLDEMFEFYSGSRGANMTLDSIEVGLLCAVKYSEDESWYRSKVLEVLGSDRYKVEFLDHGNTEECTADCVRRLLTQFTSLPLQAMHCTLGGVRSKDGPWSEEALTLFSELVGEKSLLADIVCVGSEDAYLVQLLDMGIPLSQKFIEEGFGVEASTPTYLSKKTKRVFSDSSEVTSSPVKAYTLDTSEILHEQAEEGYTPLDLVQGETYKCVFSHTISPGKFWLQLCDKLDKLQTLMDSLQERYSGEMVPAGGTAVGSLCVALCSEDSQWYRARVEAVNNDSVDVVFVDFGNSETVTISEIKEIQSEDLRLPQQSFCCSLKGVIPELESNDWENIACSRLEELTFEKEMNVCIRKTWRNGCFEVDVTDGEECLASSLVKGGYAKLKDVKMEVSKKVILADKVQEVSVAIDEQVSDESKDDDFQSAKSEDMEIELGPFKPFELDNDEEYMAVIRHIKSPGLFYIILKDSENDIAALMGHIDEYVLEHADKVLPTEEMVKGKECLAWTTDGCYCRCVITDVQDEVTQVYVVDTGVIDEVDYSLLKPLPNSMMELPAQAVPCSLSDIHPGDDMEWSEESCSCFKTLAEDHVSVSVYVDGIREGAVPINSVSVTPVGVGSRDMYNYQMVELGFAEAVKGSSLESDLTMDETEVSFNELSLLRENSFGSIDESGTDVDTSRLTEDESLLDTTGASDSFCFISGKRAEKLIEKINEDTDDEFYDAEEKDESYKLNRSSKESNVDDAERDIQEESPDDQTVTDEDSKSKGDEEQEETADDNILVEGCELTADQVYEELEEESVPVTDENSESKTDEAKEGKDSTADAAKEENAEDKHLLESDSDDLKADQEDEEFEEESGEDEPVRYDSKELKKKSPEESVKDESEDDSEQKKEVTPEIQNESVKEESLEESDSVQEDKLVVRDVPCESLSAELNRVSLEEKDVDKLTAVKEDAEASEEESVELGNTTEALNATDLPGATAEIEVKKETTTNSVMEEDISDATGDTEVNKEIMTEAVTADRLSEVSVASGVNEENKMDTSTDEELSEAKIDTEVEKTKMDVNSATEAQNGCGTEDENVNTQEPSDTEQKKDKESVGQEDASKSSDLQASDDENILQKDS